MNICFVSEKTLIASEFSGGEEMSELTPEVEERVKYRIEGEFCANCSAKMERTLSSTEGIEETTINYATKTIFLPPSRVVQAQEIMERIEAGVKLVPIQMKQNVENPDNNATVARANQWRVTRIIMACVLFAVGLALESQWKNSSGEVLEYLVYKVLAKAIRNLFRGQLFDENFLMSVATVGAIAIHALPEAVAVMLFYSIGEYLEERAVNRTRNSIQALLNFRPEYANLIHQLEVIKVDPEEVQVGQQILVMSRRKGSFRRRNCEWEFVCRYIRADRGVSAEKSPRRKYHFSWNDQHFWGLDDACHEGVC